jgi:small subunit ribosomal protein S16
LAVHLRLRRMGKRSNLLRIVPSIRGPARDGKYLDNVGTYNPRSEPAVSVNNERVVYWLSKAPNPLIPCAACCAGRAF